MRVLTGITNWLRSRKTYLSEEKRLSKDALASLYIHFCFQFGASMSGVFLNLYLWRLTHSLWVNGMYNIIVFAVTPLAFALGGWLAKKKDRMVTYRSGIFLIATFYLVVIFAQERVVDYYMLFAVFNGLAASFYWTGYLTLMYDVSTDQNRIRYMAMNMIFFTLAGLIGPALAGFVISRNEGLHGYIITFSIAFMMFLLAALGSLKIKTIATHHRAYYLKFALLLMNKNRLWLRSLFGFLVLGMLQGLLLFLPNILLFQVLPREDMIGYFGILFSGVTIAVGFLISKYAQENRLRIYLFLSAIGFVLGSLFIVWKLSLSTVIGFMVLTAICIPLQGNALSTYFYRLIGLLPLKGQLRVESVVIRELFVNTGRIIAIFTLIILYSNFDKDWLPWVLVMASAAQFLLVGLVKMHKKVSLGES